MAVQKKKKSKRIGWIIFAAVLLLVIGVYHLLLSPFMIRSLWLPMAERKSGFEIGASKISVSLLSSPTLSAKDLKLVRKDGVTATFGKVRLEANPLSCLISRRLEISNLEIVKLQLDVRSGENPQLPAKSSASGEKKRQEKARADRKSSMEIAVGKVNIYDGTIVVSGKEGRWELNGFSFSASDFMRGASPSVKFSSFLTADWNKWTVTNAKLEGGMDLRLPQDTLLPDFVKISLDLGKSAIAFNGTSMEIGLSSVLSMTKKGDIISISDSRLRVTGPDSNELVKGFVDASFHRISHAGKFKLTCHSARSALTDALFSALVSSPVKGAELDAALSADVAAGFSEVAADGKLSIRADRLMADEVRSLNSNFAVRAAKKGKSVAVSKFDFSLRDGSGKLNLDVALPKKIIFRTSPLDMVQGQIVLRSDRMNLPLLAEIAGWNKCVPVKSGLLSLMLKLKFGDRSGPCIADGSFTVSALQTAYGNRETAPADLSAGFLAILDGKRKILFRGNLSGRANRKQMLSMDCRAEIPSAWKEKPAITLSNVDINQEVLSVLPFPDAGFSGVKRFRLTGNASWSATAPEKQNLSAAFKLADVAAAGSEQPLTFHFSSDSSFTKTGIEFRKFLLTALEKENQFFDLGLGGVYVYDASGKKKNNLTVSSNYIDARKLQELVRSFSPSSAPESSRGSAPDSGERSAPSSAGASPREPGILDLSRYSGVIKFALAQVRYTDDLCASVSGPVSIGKTSVRLDNLKFTVNDSPAALRFRINTGFTDGYTYNGSLSVKNLALPPLIKAAGNGDDSGVTGSFSALQLNFSGKGVTASNFKRNLKGTLTASTRDLSFPAKSVQTVRALDLLMIPLAAVPGLSEALSSDALPEDLKQLRTTVMEILEGRRNVEFRQGVLNASASKGVVVLKQCQFEGGTLKRESVTGSVNLLSGKLNLNTVLDLGSLIVPLPVRGSLAKPKPDYKKFLVDFTRRNIKDALKPENIETTIQNVDGIIDLFKKERKERKEKTK